MNQKKRVIALGFFDGVHNGHAALMRRTAQVAKQRVRRLRPDYPAGKDKAARC